MERLRIPSYLAILLLGVMLISVGCIMKKDNEPTTNPARASVSVNEAATTTNENKEQNPLINQEASEVTVYFLTEDEEHLVPLTIPITNTEKAAKVAIERLIVGPTDEFAKPIINSSTKIIDIYVKDSIVYLDLTKHFLDFKSDNLGELAIIGVLKTLEPFINENMLQILIEGQKTDKIFGMFDLSKPISAKGEAALIENQHQLTLYFADSNGIYLVPAVRKVNTPDPITATVVELVKGPGNQSGLIPTIWPGTAVLGVTLKGDTVEVNLSRQAIGYGGGSATENLFIKSLLLSLTEFVEVHQVQLLIEGEKLEVLPEGTEVSKPLTRPAYINYRN
ncbi:MAG: GerMN domain-containing protein [Bacillota bacterium]|nr:GerMN domain-containing protein [Bacillota bacterium]